MEVFKIFLARFFFLGKGLRHMGILTFSRQLDRKELDGNCVYLEKGLGAGLPFHPK